MAWSGTQGYNAAAATPHEQKMGGLLSSWRSGFSIMMYVLLAIAAYTFLNNAHFSKPAFEVRKNLAVNAMCDVAPGKEFEPVREEVRDYIKSGKMSAALQSRVRTLPPDGLVGSKVNPDPLKKLVKTALKTKSKGNAQTFGTIYGQMLVPVAIRKFLPIGITGIFCAVMIFLLISTDTTYMHSWGSIIVQDIILPLRKRPFTPKQQLTLLRLIIAGVAVFAFVFSFFFGQVDYIIMFMQITGAIWLGGAGSCITFGLYWKRGTTSGAFAALLSGSILAVSGFFAQNLWVTHIYPWLVKVEMLDSVKWFIEGISAPFNPYIVWKVTPDKFPVNSTEILFITIATSIFLYITLSLLSRKAPFNMDKMLHRGIYNKDGQVVERVGWSFRNILIRLSGIDSQYTKWDKVLAWSILVKSLGIGFGSFIMIIIWNLISPWPVHWWANWFLIYNIIYVGIIGIISTVWFTIGGTWDLRRMFKRLESKATNIHDDGRVIGHVSTGDMTEEELKHADFAELMEKENKSTPHP